MNLSIRLYHHLFNFIAAPHKNDANFDLRAIHTQILAVLSTAIVMWLYSIVAVFMIASPVPGYIGFFCSVIHLLSPILFRFTKNSLFVASVMLFAGMIHQASYSFFTGGFESHVLIWFGILPMLGGLIAGRRGATLWFMISMLVAGGFLYLDLTHYVFPDIITAEGKFLSHALLVFGWIFLSSSIIFIFVTMIEQRELNLKEQGRKIDNLFKVLFHDLANPLGRLSIGLNILKKEKIDDKLERGFYIASQATDSMLEITQNIKNMYAASKGKVNIDLVMSELNSSIEYIRNVFSSELENKSIKIIFNAEKFLGLKLLVEPISFNNQVLGNIISNSIKYSPCGSEIHIRAYPVSSQSFVLEISDKGPGIEESVKKNLFKFDSSDLNQGYGMHIMKSFVEMYQGRVEVESSEKEGSGTTIKLFLQGKWE
jgi:signal transduction histidine kinase